MKKPSLEEVRAHFKDAKVVKNVISTFEIEDVNNIIEGMVVDTDYFYKNKLGYKKAVWESHAGYAKILEYKSKQKPMKKVIRLDEPKEESKKPIELTHFFQTSGGMFERDLWTFDDLNRYKKIIYLGVNPIGDELFSCINDKDEVILCKGHLNDGVY